MRKIGGIVIALTLAPFPGYGGEQADHREHLRAMMAAMSSHGPVIPQPATVNASAAKTINIMAQRFFFTPSSFAVDQGDVVTINVTVPASDGSPVGHGILMEAYIPSGINVASGATQSMTFTATTPGTFAFVCTQPNCGSGHSNMLGQMIVNAVAIPPPSISSVFPNSGSTAGGMTATLSGSNFQTTGVTTVQFDTTAATNINVTNASSMTVTTPAHAAGAVGVTVTNPDGQSATSPNAFTYNEPGPSITTVSPNTGSTAGGTRITIAGAGFQTGAGVTIGGIAAQNVVAVSSTSITATTQLGPVTQQASQPRDVVVTNPDGKSATKAGGFSYFVPPLSVVSIDPGAGLPGGGTVVTITGTGFTTGLVPAMTFGGLPATNVTVVNAVTLQGIAPAHGLGTVDVVVTLGASSVTKAAAFDYQVPPPRRRATRH